MVCASNPYGVRVEIPRERRAVYPSREAARDFPSRVRSARASERRGLDWRGARHHLRQWLAVYQLACGWVDEDGTPSGELGIGLALSFME